MILVEEPGLLTTVQDLGRPGYGPIGVSASGAADPVALRIGNLLLGNPENTPALEMTLTGGTYRFDQAADIALTGADFDADLPLWQVHRLSGRLRVGRARSGARCYLCLRGGIDVPKTFGSASTHVLSGLGGRRLQTGDTLRIGPEPAATSHLRVRRSALEHLAPRTLLRITPGPQYSYFPQTARDLLLSASFEVSEHANRMGVRLTGQSIEAPFEGSMMTEGVSLGAIQVPSSGHPIILFVDAQTTGGYPIIANVVSTDLPSVGQLRPRDHVRFEMVSFEQARRLYLDRERLLQSEALLW
jgi:antagonist of KipI